MGPVLLFGKRFLLLSLLVLFLFAACFAGWMAYALFTPGMEQGKDQFFIVKEGQTLAEVAAGLERSGILTASFPLILWGKAQGFDKRIKAGEYNLNARMNAVEILERLTKGTVLTYSVTIPEGFTVRQIADLLHEKGLCDKETFLSSVHESPAGEGETAAVADLEGYLYPDTYRVARGTAPASIVGMMVDRFLEMTGPYREKMEESGMTIHEIVTLASMVEKEAGNAAERPVIAGVFFNRLKRGMRLQSDPTVIYGIKNFNGNLTRVDLRRPGPYNTYTQKGLPPGPIANPGIDAIRAVLNPSDTDFLYFVSKNDGTHHFSKTLQEHNSAVRKYQKRSRKSSG